MPHIALLFHGDRETRDNLRFEDHRLFRTAEVLREVGLQVEPAVYNDDFADEVSDQLLKLDGVLVWVNPITEDGGGRARLDVMLKEVADAGVFVSAHPDTIQTMGTKDVLYKTRQMGWGSDVHLYRTPEEIRDQLPGRLSQGPRVLKRHRGHSGQGVWKVSLGASPDEITVRHAARGSVEEKMTLDEWVERCRDCLDAGPMLDQEFNPRIVDGTVRCYLIQDQVEGFGHQEVNALVPDADPGPRLYSPPDDARFQVLKETLEKEWLPEMLRTLGMSIDELPMLWDTDFMLREGGGYMLCEINVSSVYPYPESAMGPLARATAARLNK